jgi:hypothetical protein
VTAAILREIEAMSDGLRAAGGKKAQDAPSVAKRSSSSSVPAARAPLVKRAPAPAGSRLFVEIDTLASGPGGAMIVSGCVPLDDPRRLVLPDPILHEMGGDKATGELTDLRLLADGLFVRAVVSDRVAAAKVRERVYRGFGLVVAADGRIERAALVDHPEALGKGPRAQPAILKVSIEGKNMKPSILVNQAEARQIEREWRDRAAHERRMEKASAHDFRKASDQEKALDVIRLALRSPIRPAFAFGLPPR